MAQQEKGNWKPYNVDYIVGNVRSVFENRDINKLSKGAYKFITLHMGFIAHYSLYGFRSEYADLKKFALALLTSEYSTDRNYTLKEAGRRVNDKWFSDQYGKAYNQSISDAVIGIRVEAITFLAGRMAPKPKTKYKVKSKGGRVTRTTPVDSILGLAD